jgi:hypothetical protein
MKYMLLIYSAPDAGPQWGTPERDLQMKRYFEFSTEVVEKGLFVGGDPLEDPSTATTVRVRDGKTLTTDGPFAETKEVLGGYYVLECENLDQALEYAAKIPSAEFGSIEVRPLMSIPGM